MLKGTLTLQSAKLRVHPKVAIARLPPTPASVAPAAIAPPVLVPAATSAPLTAPPGFAFPDYPVTIHEHIAYWFDATPNGGPSMVALESAGKVWRKGNDRREKFRQFRALAQEYEARAKVLGEHRDLVCDAMAFEQRNLGLSLSKYRVLLKARHHA